MQKRRIKTLGELSPLILLLLTCIVASTSNFPPTRARLVKKIKTISKKVLGAKKAKEEVTTTLL